MDEEIEIDVKLIIAYTQRTEKFLVTIPEGKGVGIDELTKSHLVYNEELLFEYLCEYFHLIKGTEILVLDKFINDGHTMEIYVNIILSTFEEYKYYHRNKVLNSL